MKFSMLFFFTLFSFSSQAEVRTGYRIIKDVPLEVTKCNEPTAAHLFQIETLSPEAEISITTPVTTVKAVSAFQSKKCRTSEIYKMRKVGWFSNTRWEEIPGTAVRSSQVINDYESTERLKTIRDYEYPALQTELDKLDRQMISSALAECQTKLKKMKEAIVDIRRTSCR